MLLSKLKKQVSDPDWEDLAYFARLIPRVCHNINRSVVEMENLWKRINFFRICYIFGGPVEHPVIEVCQSEKLTKVRFEIRWLPLSSLRWSSRQSDRPTTSLIKWVEKMQRSGRVHDWRSGVEQRGEDGCSESDAGCAAPHPFWQVLHWKKSWTLSNIIGILCSLNCSQISAGASAVVLQICCYQAVQVKGGSIQH